MGVRCNDITHISPLILAVVVVVDESDCPLNKVLESDRKGVFE